MDATRICGGRFTRAKRQFSTSWIPLGSCKPLPFLKLTASFPLKISGWKMKCPFRCSIFRGYVSFRECKSYRFPNSRNKTKLTYDFVYRFLTDVHSHNGILQEISVFSIFSCHEKYENDQPVCSHPWMYIHQLSLLIYGGLCGIRQDEISILITGSTHGTVDG